MLSNTLLSVFQLLEEKGVGTQTSIFYLTWATTLEEKGEIVQSEQIFQKGLETLAQIKEEHENLDNFFKRFQKRRTSKLLRTMKQQITVPSISNELKDTSEELDLNQDKTSNITFNFKKKMSSLQPPPEWSGKILDTTARLNPPVPTPEPVRLLKQKMEETYYSSPSSTNSSCNPTPSANLNNTNDNNPNTLKLPNNRPPIEAIQVYEENMTSEIGMDFHEDTTDIIFTREPLNILKERKSKNPSFPPNPSLTTPMYSDPHFMNLPPVLSILNSSSSSSKKRLQSSKDQEENLPQPKIPKLDHPKSVLPQPVLIQPEVEDMRDDNLEEELDKENIYVNSALIQSKKDLTLSANPDSKILQSIEDESKNEVLSILQNLELLLIETDFEVNQHIDFTSQIKVILQSLETNYSNFQGFVEKRNVPINPVWLEILEKTKNGEKETGTLDFDDNSFYVVKPLSKDTQFQSFRFLVCSLENMEDLTNSYFEIQYQKQPIKVLWEFYITSTLKERLSLEKISSHFSLPFSLYFHQNGSFLVSNFYVETLQTIIDLYWKTQTNMDEHLVLFYALQLMKIVKTLHSAEIIHCNIQPKNLILTYPSMNEEEWNTDSFDFQDWAFSQKLLLRGFEKSIDFHIFPKGTTFEWSGYNDKIPYAETKLGKNPFTLQPDYFGICSTVYYLLFGTTMHPTFDFNLQKWNIDCTLNRFF